MSIDRLVRHCPLCDRPVMGIPMIYNNMHFHARCIANKQARDAYIFEIMIDERLKALMYHEGYTEEDE